MDSTRGVKFPQRDLLGLLASKELKAEKTESKEVAEHLSGGYTEHLLSR